MVSCPWAVTTRVNTHGWAEGLYYLILTGGSGQAHMIPLVVESASVKGKAVLVVNDCTMEAYNTWGGYSLYTGPGNRYRTRSYKVSFDRPYSNFTEIDERDSPLVRAAEAIRDPGVRLAYTTEARISLNPSLVKGAAAMIFSGHSEYWSLALRRNVETARNHGTNIVFFGANNVYWRTRLEPSPAGAGRVEVCYREAQLDPLRFSHPEAVTTQWRQGPRPDAESTLTGAVYGDLHAAGTFTVTDPGFFAFAGTGASRGATYPGLVQGETDQVYPIARYPLLRHPASLHVFAHSPESGRHTRHGWADSTFYTTASGAGVLDMASMDWLRAQTEATVPARSRAFASHVTHWDAVAYLQPFHRRHQLSAQPKRAHDRRSLCSHKQHCITPPTVALIATRSAAESSAGFLALAAADSNSGFCILGSGSGGATACRSGCVHESIAARTAGTGNRSPENRSGPLQCRPYCSSIGVESATRRGSGRTPSAVTSSADL